MNCRRAQQLLNLVLPGSQELDPAEAHALQRHLTGCADCRAEQRALQSADAEIGQLMRAVPVPAGLRERLLGRLSVERRQVYRRWFVSTAMAAAATLLIASFSYWYWQVKPQEVVLNPAGSEPYDPVVPTVTPEAVREHFRGLGYEVQLPGDLVDTWDFRLLTAKELASYQDVQVPTLTFRKGTATATIRLLRQGQFDAKALGHLRPGVDPHRLVLGNPSRDAWIALVEFSGGAQLRDFLHPKQGLA
jgi:hypothetical protein